MGGWVDLDMTRYITLLLFINLIWGQNITIAVFDFENNGLETNEVRQLSTRLESELVKLGDFKVVERTKIDEVLKEQKLQMSGCAEECLIDVGEILGANQIILGSIGKIGGLYTLSAKLVDVESGELLMASDFDAENGLRELLQIGLKEVAYELTGVSIENANYKEHEKIILDAESEAENNHDDQLFKYLGAGSCITGFGIPLSFLMLRSKPPYNTNLDTSSPKYLQLKNSEEQRIYKDAYYEKENSLRRKSVHKMQGICFGVYMLFVLIGMDIESSDTADTVPR